MTDRIVQHISLIGFACIAVLFIAELVRWRSLTSIIGRKQRILRVVLIAMVEVLFALLFVGPWITARHNPVAALIYWGSCTLLSLGVAVLAIMDLREVLRGYVALHRRMFGDLQGDDRRDR